MAPIDLQTHICHNEFNLKTHGGMFYEEKNFCSILSAAICLFSFSSCGSSESSPDIDIQGIKDDITEQDEAKENARESAEERKQEEARENREKINERRQKNIDSGKERRKRLTRNYWKVRMTAGLQTPNALLPFRPAMIPHRTAAVQREIQHVSELRQRIKACGLRILFRQRNSRVFVMPALQR